MASNKTSATRSCPPITRLVVQNFRQFEELPLSNLRWANVIMGANGSGKTSLLWAIIVALRSYNLRTAPSNHKASASVQIHPLDFAKLINAPQLGGASSWGHISRHGAAEPTLIHATINNRSICWEIKADDHN
ncbi:hypothetical protein QOT17_007897 [Balamuthia mandrillaris]